VTSQWLFPSGFTRKSQACMTSSRFSTHLTALAEGITGKRFSNRLMRSSFIRWWHETHPQASNAQVQRIMHSLLQQDIAIHLAYRKLLDGDST
jgi:hypothetical protein